MIEQEKISSMFDRIAPSYDRTNRILSWGQDQRWRYKLAECLAKDKPLTVLDIATGTADLLLCMSELRPNINYAVGVDLAEKMLAIGREKVAKTNHPIVLKSGDAMSLPFADNFFDVVSISFGIRNVAHLNKALQEIIRVLKPDGKALILEFSLPSNALVKLIYLAYFRHVLPLLGGFLSRDLSAYRYLNRSVESFPCSQAFGEILKNAGFLSVQKQPLSLGIATLYEARITLC